MSVLFGMVIGLALGLTGGGGSIFAVPMLVYGVHLSPHQAVVVSLAAVALTAALGAVAGLRAGLIEARAGLLFALGGMLGAPFGTRLGAMLPGDYIVAGFAVLMLVVAVLMWRGTLARREPAEPVASGRSCRYAPAGGLRVTTPCVALLLAGGVAVGVLSGFFGVGGGFVIVPVLMLVTGMAIHRAVATSLLVIALVGVSGVSSALLAGRGLPWLLTVLFVIGGAAGMLAGRRLARRLAGPRLQQVFASAMLGVATFMLATRL